MLPSVILGVFVNAINIVRGGVGTTYAMGVSKRFTIERAC
jgi:hypothetical protein